MNDITPKEAIANLNHIYGFVAPDIQRSLDVAIKALEEHPSGDLISREALKEHKVYSEERHEYVVPVYNIDNAQAVEQNWRFYYDHGYKQAEKDLKRPKGEWLFKHNSSDIWCSVCDENFDEIPQAFNFCPNCGADMRAKENLNG